MYTFYMGHWIPEYLAQLLIVMAGLAMIFQAHRVAGTLFLLAMGSIFMPPILQIVRPLAWQTTQQAPTAISAGVIQSIGAPVWTHGIISTLISMMVIYGLFVIVVLGTVRWIFGREVFAQMMGALLVEPVRFLLIWPFLLIRWLIRRMIRRP